METTDNIYHTFQPKLKAKFKPDPALKLMDQVKQVLRYHHYAFRIEQSYCEWILKFIKFFGSKTHPRNMGKSEIEQFLSSLAIEKNVNAVVKQFILQMQTQAK